jgi:iron complex outermembrane receptor protein
MIGQQVTRASYATRSTELSGGTDEGIGIEDARAALSLAQAEGQHPQSRPSPEEGEKNDSGTTNESSRQTLDEVIVTAQRREQNLQSVPIAVTVITESMLQSSAGTLQTTDLARLSPGLVMNRDHQAAIMFLRGVGTTNDAFGFEPAVAIYVDGVYFPTPYAGIFQLSDAERVEVLKGPQGTLFGRNSTGGVIQVVTRTPDADRRTDVSVTYSSFHTIESSVYSNGAITDNLAGNLAIYAQDQSDGWGRNLFNGLRDAYKSREVDIRGKLKWAADSTSFVLAADYADSNSNTGSLAYLRPPSVYPDHSHPDFYDVNVNTEPFDKTTQKGVSGTIEHDFGKASLTSISSYRLNDTSLLIDNDLSSLPLLQVSLNARQPAVSQELRLASDSTSPLSWILGGYFFNFNTIYYQFNQGTQLGKNLYQAISSYQHVRSYAEFAQATYAITSTLNLTAGVRYTDDSRLFNVSNALGTNPPAVANGLTGVVRRPSYRASIDNRFNDQLMAYMSFNQSFRTGAYNPASATAPLVRPEVGRSYEVGVKSDFFNRHLRINAAAFHYDFTDIQLQQNFAGITSTYNAASAKINGGELEVSALPFENLTLNGGLSVLDGHYGNFPGDPQTTPVPTGGSSTIYINGEGKDTIRTPPFTLNFSADYVIPTSTGDYKANLSYYHSARYAADPANVLFQNAYNTLNAVATWSSLSHTFDVSAWGRNLSEAKYCNRLNAASQGFVCAPAEPRTLGITLKFHFH